MRRPVLLRAAIVLGLLALIAACGGSKKENVEPPAELTEFSPTVDVSEVWSRSIGDGERLLSLRQHPVVSGGRVYAADVERGEVVALDAANGSELWSVETELRLSGGPGVGEGTLAVGSLKGDVIALNPDTGSERWRAKVSSEVISTPAIANGVVVVRSNDGRVFGYAATDGERRWVYDRGVPSLTLRGNGSPMAADGVVYLGYDNGQVVALRIEDGVQLWEQTVAVGEGRTELDRMVDIDGEMIVDSGELFAASFNGQVLGIALDGGRPLWNREVSSYAGLALGGEKILLSDRDGTVWALDRSTGSALWKQEALAHRWLSTPAIHGNYAVFGDLEGYLHWISLENGELAARQRLDKEPIRATPQVEGDMLYAVSIEGQLGAFRIN
ncbi:outer membrane protein assembly factor BamB [Chiayiivirga flava]|uniref:Outer membrane protein assembly factor BamB n=1 Tax=Chiayiivirga flava TaxID=659595 RepID=A0A7W8FZI7_9GAMM|nr:outer membrane protein assembly factor BamB [Chiayiivirga flava]MBB5208522.1 outer membrane protein assembly factor BamB [Chiayiivirga flava]